MEHKLNSTQFVQLLEQDLQTLEEKSKEYIFDRLLELFQYKEVKSVMINNYSSFGVELHDKKNNVLSFVTTSNSVNNNHNSGLPYYIVVHDEEDKLYILSDIIKHYENIYKKIHSVNSKYVAAHHRVTTQNYNEPHLRIERDKIEVARKFFFSPEHFERYKAREEKEQLENSISNPSINSPHKFKM